MSRIFGTSGDIISSSAVGAGGLRTYALWAYRTGEGESSNGRLWSKREPLEFQMFTSPTQYTFQAGFSTTVGEWRIPKPASNAWQHVLVVYDHSSTANDPVIYVNGVSQTVTEAATPAGTSDEGSAPFNVGNIPSPSRVWDGRLAEFVVWDRGLTADEVAQIAGGISPLDIHAADLLIYWPIVGDSPEEDLSGNNNDGTVTGTTVSATHPFSVEAGYELVAPGTLYSWWTVPPSAPYPTGQSAVGGDERTGNTVIRTTEGDRVELLTGIDRDDHQNPAILIPDDAVPLVAYTRHNDDATMRYRKGTVIGDITTLGAQSTITASGVITYSQLWRNGDDVWLLSRLANNDWVFWKSDDYGATWGAQTHLLDQASQFYITSAQDGTTVRCAAARNPSGGDNRIWYFEVDLTTGAITEADGTVIANLDGTGLPFSVDADMLAFTGSVGNTVRLFAVSDASEIAFAEFDDGLGVAGDYKVVTFAAGWTAETLVSTGVPFDGSSYFGGMAFPPSTAGGDVFLAREASQVWTVERWSAAGGWAMDSLIATSNGQALGRPWPVGSNLMFFDVSSYPDFESWDGGNIYVAQLATGPDTPTNPAATTLSSSSIRVTWDNVADETGYRVERSLDGSTGWADVSGNLAADTTQYDDTGLTASTQYFYRVIAFNANGDSSPSSTVNATTDATPTPPPPSGAAVRRPPRIRS